MLIYNLLLALRYLHQAGVIHRDLKPNNILVNMHCQVQLCDFGWARTIEDQVQEEVGTVRKRTQDFCTRYYRPPEVILRYSNYDTRTDIWSFGCIVAELVRYWLVSSQPELEKKIKSHVLFKGESCYPLSPVFSEGGSDMTDSNDQLVLILRTLGIKCEPCSQYTDN